MIDQKKSSDRERKKNVRGVVTKGCVVWLVELLRHLAREGGVGRQQVSVSRWRDHLGIVIVSICISRSGSFVKLEIALIQQNKKRIFLCLPAGKNGGGWLTVGDALSDVVGSGPPAGEPSSMVGAWTSATTPLGRTYCDAARGLDGDYSREVHSREKKIRIITNRTGA